MGQLGGICRLSPVTFRCHYVPWTCKKRTHKARRGGGSRRLPLADREEEVSFQGAGSKCFLQGPQTKFYEAKQGDKTWDLVSSVLCQGKKAFSPGPKANSSKTKADTSIFLRKAPQIENWFQKLSYWHPQGPKITWVKGQIEAWQLAARGNEEKIEKAASWWCVKTPYFLGATGLRSGMSTSSIRWHSLSQERNSQIGWSCCSGPSWHSRRPPAAGWTVGWCPWRAVTAKRPQVRKMRTPTPRCKARLSQGHGFWMWWRWEASNPSPWDFWRIYSFLLTDLTLFVWSCLPAPLSWRRIL